jgi:hypothetical protein
MVDRDLAELYGVSTKALNQAVKRNFARFPVEFMFQLNNQERDELVTNCDRFKTMKHSSSLPMAFTEHGIAMLSSVLKSEQAIQINILIMKTFIKMRSVGVAHKNISKKIAELEKRVGKHDEDIHEIIKAIQQLVSQEEKPKRRMGFHAD